MDRARPQVLRYTATKEKDVAAGRGMRTGTGEGERGNMDRRRLTVTQEAFSSFPNHPNFALGIAQGESIHGHPRLALPPCDILVGESSSFRIQVNTLYRYKSIYIARYLMYTRFSVKFYEEI